MNANIAMIVVFLLDIVIIIVVNILVYRKYKSILDSHLNSLKLFPKKPRFTLALFFYNLLGFILFAPIFWIIMRRNDFPFYYLCLFLVSFLPGTISAYPCFTLSIDDKNIRGAQLWGGWHREEIPLSEINWDKVSRQNLGIFLGITILYSNQGRKILTLGLDSVQITKILELAKSNTHQDKS